MAKGKKPDKLERFFERLATIVGLSLFESIKKTFVERPTTFRVNTIKSNIHEVRSTLQTKGFKIEQVLWYKDAFILKNKSKRELTTLDIYKEGKIYIQSLASMVPPLVMDIKSGEKVLDLTAAPGSKTSQIAALMNCEGKLLANDSNKIRFFKLKHNLEQLGVMDCGLDIDLRLEPGTRLCREYEEPYFDKILLDAPCSSETRFELNRPKTYAYWNERKIKEMAYKQRKLFLAAWTVLKPGGTLVYSTCTFAPEENEVQVSKFLEKNEDAIVEEIKIKGLKSLPILTKWKDRELDKDVKKCLRMYPTKDVQGFFVAKITKKSKK